MNCVPAAITTEPPDLVYSFEYDAKVKGQVKKALLYFKGPKVKT